MKFHVAREGAVLGEFEEQIFRNKVFSREWRRTSVWGCWASQRESSESPVRRTSSGRIRLQRDLWLFILKAFSCNHFDWDWAADFFAGLPARDAPSFRLL